MADITVRVAGEAGQGVQTTGNLLVGAFSSMGLHLFSSQSYMSRIRGGLNWFDIRIADKELFSGKEKADILIALTDEARTKLSSDVAEGGTVVYDGEDCDNAVCLALTAAARETGGSPLMANAVAAGVVFSMLGYDDTALRTFLEKEFSRKGEDVVSRNVACAVKGVELGREAPGVAGPEPSGAPGATPNGSEAVGLGAAAAGVRFVTSYPMTPSTGVFTFLAGAADEYGIVVEQAEDEIAAINMVCGAVYAGAPAMTTTSGGGFALMCEGLSLAGMMELPAVILLSQRPGPATGLPTRTAQQDLGFVLHAGHGEFPRALFAPGTPEQSYHITKKAFETAHHFQTPAVIMIDQYMADYRKNCVELDKGPNPVDRFIVEEPDKGYVRYADSSDGISPRALPGGDVFVVSDSDEHFEDGHITEDLSVRVKMEAKRLRKQQGMADTAVFPEYYGPDQAERLLICWGSTYGPCREAVDILNHEGEEYAMLHFSQVWPLHTGSVKKITASRDIFCVEGNETGLFAAILRERGIVSDPAMILRCDGMPFTGEEIARRAAK